MCTEAGRVSVTGKSEKLGKVLGILLTGTISATTSATMIEKAARQQGSTRRYSGLSWRGKCRGSSSNLKGWWQRNSVLLAWRCSVQPEAVSAITVVFTAVQESNGHVLVPSCPTLLWRGSIQNMVLIISGTNVALLHLPPLPQRA